MARALLLFVATAVAVLPLVRAVAAGHAPAPPAGYHARTARPPAPAEALSTFVRLNIAWRVATLENALATTNRTLLAYCPRSQRTLI
jgi:hypothetical protein